MRDTISVCKLEDGWYIADSEGNEILVSGTFEDFCNVLDMVLSEEE